MAKKESRAQAKVHKVMHEYKHGKLCSTKKCSKGGSPVSSRKQAIAIALSEAGKGRK